MDKLDPMRMKLRIDWADPSVIQSKTLMRLPNLQLPYTDMLDPKRAKLRMEKPLPN
jgi:hypothetical protein